MHKVTSAIFKELEAQMDEIWVETIRFDNGKAPLLKQHLDRLSNCLKRYHNVVKFDQQVILKWVNELLGKNNIGLFKARLLLGVRNGEMFYYSELQPVCDTITPIRIIDLHIWPEQMQQQGKCYKNLKLIQKWQQLQSYDTAATSLIINKYGHVKEAMYANVFGIKDNVLYMIPIDEQIVPGVFQSCMLALPNIHLEPKKMTIQELQECEAVFLTNAVRGIVPVEQLIDKPKNVQQVIALQKSIKSLLF